MCFTDSQCGPERTGLLLLFVIVELIPQFLSCTGAARECHLSGGDFLDSTLYVNCDGTPRYAEKGFVQWLEELQSQRATLRAKNIDGECEVHEQVAAQPHSPLFENTMQEAVTESAWQCDYTSLSIKEYEKQFNVRLGLYL